MRFFDLWILVKNGGGNFKVSGWFISCYGGCYECGEVEMENFEV